MNYPEPTPQRHGSCPPDLVASHGAAAVYLHAATPGSRIAGLVAGMPIKHRCRQPGEYLFRAGDAFHFFHVLHAGFAKTCHLSADGRERTTGFHMRGDILGLDAVASGAHSCDGVALDGCEVLAIPYDALVEHCQRSPALLRELHCAFSAEIRGDRDQMLNLGSLLAEGRVAAFLLEMSARFGARGFSPTQLQLRLTRQEIGSMLSLKLETVSRVFSLFARQGLISVNLREIVLLDREGLLDIISRPGGRDRKRRHPARANPAPRLAGATALAA